MPRKSVDRREFCIAVALGGLGLVAAGLTGCSDNNVPANAVGQSSSPDDLKPVQGVIANTDTTLILPSNLSASGLHPSLIDFATEHGMKTWAGYRYWLAWTPYTDFTTEFPTLAASNDLTTWVKPLGLPNPITKTIPNDFGANARLNDPEICYDKDANCINLYHGVYNTGGMILAADGSRLQGGLFRYRIFSDGTIKGRRFDRGAPFTSCCVPGLAGGSVTVHREAAGKWHMWESAFAYRTSKDGFHWSDSAPCTVGTPDSYRSTTRPAYMRGWRFNHAGGKFNPGNGRVEFAVSCTPPGGIGGADENLAMVACDLANPTAMYVMLDTWLLTHRRAGIEWDGGSTYRSMLMPHPTDQNKRRLIYSAFKMPCTRDYATPNRISTVVEGDISGALLAKALPSR